MHTAIRSVKIELSSEKQTEELANQFQKKLKPGNVVFLLGEMGVGKTTFPGLIFLKNLFANSSVCFSEDKSI